MAQLYTCPLNLIPPSAEEAWQALCADCFRQVLEVEPTADLLMVPIPTAGADTLVMTQKG
jgi:hypothetical protein